MGDWSLHHLSGTRRRRKGRARLEFLVVLDWFRTDLPKHGTYAIIQAALFQEQVLARMTR